jgi:hypothetical protein
MKPKHTLLLGSALSILAPACFATGVSPVLFALKERNYSAATAAARGMPAQAAVAALRVPAALNNTPAQWMLAEAYWRAGDKGNSGKWAYMARMGTILDASVCSSGQARSQTDRLIARSYKVILDYVHNNTKAEQDALFFAAMHYSANYAKQQDPSWTCRAWAIKSQHPVEAMTFAPDTWINLRRDVMTDVLKKSHLPYLIAPLPAEISDDPLKRDFNIKP